MYQVSLTVKTTGQPPEKYVADFAQNLNAGLKDMAEAIREKALDTVDAQRKRTAKPATAIAPAHLRDSIQVEQIAGGYGIGNLERMQKETPYWKVLNDGGYIPPKTRGRWSGAGSTDAFIWDKGGANKDPFMTPKKPIQATNYIELTFAWAKTFLDQAVSLLFK